MTRSGLYFGQVMHRRLRPREHRFSYRVFSMLLDLDEIPALDAGSRLFGYNRAAVFGFRDSDHGDGVPGGLRGWVEAHLRRAGIEAARPRIELLCYPRMFGYVFNPLTVYFCHGAEDRLVAILYEVANTFGEKHTYVMPIHDGGPRDCAKDFYVSPFLPMACSYRFHVTPPEEKVAIRIDESDAEGLILIASFAGERHAFSDATLARALLRYPLMTLKVVAGIHWEALRLWRKGVGLHRHRAAASRVASTVVATGAASPRPGE